MQLTNLVSMTLDCGQNRAWGATLRARLFQGLAIRSSRSFAPRRLRRPSDPRPSASPMPAASALLRPPVGRTSSIDPQAGLCAESLGSAGKRTVALRSASHSPVPNQGRPDSRLPHGRLSDRQGTSPSRWQSLPRFPQESGLKGPLDLCRAGEP